MTTLREYLESMAGLELRVTTALPFEGHTAAGEYLGPIHWLPMHDYVYVSQELYDQLKAKAARG